jgi:AcrR family transcriptional regulator
MSRPRTLDRERLLDVAETIIKDTGAAGLSFGSLAAASGVPKASIQSAFGARDALLDAILERWLAREQARFDVELAGRASDRDRVMAHLAVTANLTPDEGKAAAALMVALARANREQSNVSQWYSARVGTLMAETAGERQLRTAFLAAEGAYFLRYLFELPINDRLWREIFSDLEELAKRA